MGAGVDVFAKGTKPFGKAVLSITRSSIGNIDARRDSGVDVICEMKSNSSADLYKQVRAMIAKIAVEDTGLVA
jgi:hypothetical protein